MSHVIIDEFYDKHQLAKGNHWLLFLAMANGIRVYYLMFISHLEIVLLLFTSVITIVSLTLIVLPHYVSKPKTNESVWVKKYLLT
jgi:hypothetical protein